MKKSIFIGMFLGLLPVMAIAQEVKTDTIRTGLQAEFIEAIGDSTDLVVAGDGTSNWFLSFSGGINSLAAEANRVYDNFMARSRFVGRISVGKWFTPVWGFKVQMGAGRLSGHSKLSAFQYSNIYGEGADRTEIPADLKYNISEKYGEYWLHRKFAYMDWSVSVITDAVRWFTNDMKPVRLILSAGPGFAHAFGAQGMGANNSFAFKAGIQLNVNLNKHWDVFGEFQGTIVDETFDGQIGGITHKRNRSVEGYGGLSVGLSYKFGGRKFKRYAKVNPVTYEQIRYRTAPKQETRPVVKDTTVTAFAVRFFIDQSNIEEDQKLNIERVARYLLRYPEARLELTGFADKETAYPEYNMKLSERRVKAVYDYLVDKCGIAPSRLTINAKGDTERVYNEDYRWNRVVIMRIVNDENEK